VFRPRTPKAALNVTYLDKTEVLLVPTDVETTLGL
jgi:hypothetical protein